MMKYNVVLFLGRVEMFCLVEVNEFMYFYVYIKIIWYLDVNKIDIKLKF